MNFVHSEEQEELWRVVRSFLADTSPPAEVRRLMETGEGYEPAVWRRMAEELGLHGLAIPEEYGGSGFGWAELGGVFEEMGRALAGGPFLATVAVAAGVLLALRDRSAAADLLPGIARGETIATLAHGEGGDVAARLAGGRWTLQGHQPYVLDGLVANLVLVAAGGSLFGVDGDAPGLVREPMGTMDLTRKLARLRFDGTPARLIGAEGEAATAVEAGLAWGAIALANEQVGGAQRCLDMTVDYARTREQFGRKIGSFQAVKHACADLLCDIEAARSTAAYANWAADSRDGGEMLMAASLAKAACSDAYVNAAAECIQIHGALGFTWVHDAHLYFKRAKSSALLFGDPTHHRALLASRLGL